MMFVDCASGAVDRASVVLLNRLKIESQTV
jgi:hypothetical protein